ncbi:DUF6223 family protein [Nocardia sp. X0981]
MSVHHLLAVAEVPVQSAAAGLTAGRFWSLVGVVAGLAGVIIGVRVLLHRGGRRSALAALVAGLAGLQTGGLVVAAAEGGPGTGYGIVGGFLAVAVGIVATVLGVLALKRRPQPR